MLLELEGVSYMEKLDKLGLFSLEFWRLRGDFLTIFLKIMRGLDSVHKCQALTIFSKWESDQLSLPFNCILFVYRCYLTCWVFPALFFILDFQKLLNSASYSSDNFFSLYCANLFPSFWNSPDSSDRINDSSPSLR